MNRLYPLRFEPLFKRYLWGGSRLGTLLGKEIGPESDYAESWEIADHAQGVSRVADGSMKGTTLHELIEAGPERILGPDLAGVRRFPLLVKFLDANQALSVQVHPDDETGRRLVDDSGKTEAWVILHADPGACIYAGFSRIVSPSEFEAAMESADIESLLHRLPVSPGDCILIPAGTIHAIGAGIVLAEVQQSSDATFRIHDWGRTDANGMVRATHIPQALESIDFGSGPIQPARPRAQEFERETIEDLAACAYFVVKRRSIRGAVEIGGLIRFSIVIGLEGDLVVRYGSEEYGVSRGSTLLLPAEIGACEIRPVSESSQILECTVL